MAKVIFKDEKSLQDTKDKARGGICYRKTKYGVIVAKWPKRKI